MSDLREARLEAIEGVLELMRSVGTLNLEDDAIIPHSNGYSCWFIPKGALGTAPLSAEEILVRIESRQAHQQILERQRRNNA